MLTLLSSKVTDSLSRTSIRQEIRISVFLLIIASIVTTLELALNAFFHELYLVLGIFIPLIVTNCAIIARAEAFAFKNSVGRSFVDGLTMGLGFTLVLVILGAMRESLGQGTLLTQAHLMFGDAAQWMTITLYEDYHGLLLAILPPGAFIGLGLLIAVKNVIDARIERRKEVITIIAQEATELPAAT